MITITDISNGVTRNGLTEYEVTLVYKSKSGEVQKKSLAIFTHRKSDGYTICIEKAGKAVRNQESVNRLKQIGAAAANAKALRKLK